jgi:hypothetical protein
MCCNWRISMALRPLWALALFQFLNLYTVGRTPWMGDQPVARPLPLPRTPQTQNKRRETSMPWVEFEPPIPAFQRAKTVHALDLSASANGQPLHPRCKTRMQMWLFCLFIVIVTDSKRLQVHCRSKEHVTDLSIALCNRVHLPHRVWFIILPECSAPCYLLLCECTWVRRPN